MSRSRQPWAPCNRLPGEHYDAWHKRNHEAHREAWRAEKIARGEWLSAEAYAEKTGRPGATLTPAEALRAQEAEPIQETTEAATAETSRAALDTATGGWEAAFGAEAAALGKDAAVLAGFAFAAEVIREGAEVDLGHAARQSAAAALKGTARNVATRGVAAGIRRGTAALGLNLGAAGARNALRGNAVSALAGLVVAQGIDTVNLARGTMQLGEYGRRAAGNVARTGGGLGGSVVGGALGTLVLPGIGTAIGSFLGGMFGSVGAHAATDALLDR